MYSTRKLRSWLGPQCSYPPYRPRHQRRLANCDWIPASYQRITFLFSQASILLSFVAMESHCLWHSVPWSMNICSTQRSPDHRVKCTARQIETPISNRRTQNSSVFLTKTTYMRRTGRITNGIQSGRTTLQDSALSSPTPALSLSEWPS